MVLKFRLKIYKQTLPTVRKIWLRCAKGNSYKRTIRKRLTGSRMTNFHFKLTLTRILIRWQVEVQEPTYNNEAFRHAMALPRYRQRAKEASEVITNISAGIIAPSKILINLLKGDIIISL